MKYGIEITQEIINNNSEFLKNETIGTVKIFYQLPLVFNRSTGYKGSSTLVQQNADGIYEVVDNALSQYQKYGELLPEHLVGNQYITPIVNFTPQEIIDYDLQQIRIAEQQLDNDASAQVERNYQQDGALAYSRIKFRIKRAHTDGTITEAQFRTVRKFLSPAIFALNFGDWDIAQDNLNALQEPTNAKLLAILNKVKQIVDDYIIANNF